MTHVRPALILLAGLLASLAAPAIAQAPNFGPALYADGETYGTKGTTVLPAPNVHNRQSFDDLYVVTNSNSPMGQLPVAEAAPGNPAYNGGRWFTHTVEWTEDGFLAHGIVPILKSADDVHYHEQLGHLVITPGSFPNGPPVYFQCPILPDKS